MFNHSFLSTLDILYVESDKEVSSHFSNILRKLFSSVLLAETGSDAIKRFKDNQNDDFDIDIVLCDTSLPDTSGVEVLGQIREIDSDIPFILTTSDIDVDNLLKAIKLQATDFLVKPINAKDLVFCVEKVCQNRHHEGLKIQGQQDMEDLIDVINEVSLVTKTDTKGVITFANKFFCKISNYEESELIGQTQDIINDPSASELLLSEVLREVNKGNIWEGKSKNLSKNKEEFYVYLTVVPLSNEYNEIDEIMWVRFLSTEDVLEQKEFKKKVAKNIHANRRINTEARDKIDELQNKLINYRNIDISLVDEQKRNSKFKSQIAYFRKESEVNEKKLKEVSGVANIKIKKVLESEKEVREKRDETFLTLGSLTRELESKNKSIKDLTSELDKQVKIIDKLKRDIQDKEDLIGL